MGIWKKNEAAAIEAAKIDPRDEVCVVYEHTNPVPMEITVPVSWAQNNFGFFLSAPDGENILEDGYNEYPFYPKDKCLVEARRLWGERFVEKEMLLHTTKTEPWEEIDGTGRLVIGRYSDSEGEGPGYCGDFY